MTYILRIMCIHFDELIHIQITCLLRNVCVRKTRKTQKNLTSVSKIFFRLTTFWLSSFRMSFLWRTNSSLASVSLEAFINHIATLWCQRCKLFPIFHKYPSIVIFKRRRKTFVYFFNNTNTPTDDVKFHKKHLHFSRERCVTRILYNLQ